MTIQDLISHLQQLKDSQGDLMIFTHIKGSGFNDIIDLDDIKVSTNSAGARIFRIEIDS